MGSTVVGSATEMSVNQKRPPVFMLSSPAPARPLRAKKSVIKSGAWTRGVMSDLIGWQSLSFMSFCTACVDSVMTRMSPDALAACRFFMCRFISGWMLPRRMAFVWPLTTTGKTAMRMVMVTRAMVAHQGRPVLSTSQSSISWA